MEQETTASRVLRLPEIVSAVLAPLQWRDGQPLVACTLVNSLWEREANRLLWEICGSEMMTNVVPLISTLAALELERRQKYANYIRSLTIYHQDNDKTYTIQHWTGRHLPQLAQVSFPRLEELELSTPRDVEDTSNYQPCSLLPFAQPKLKFFLITEGDLPCRMVSEELLQRLERHCNGLETVSFPLNSIDVTVDRITSFLLSRPSLEQVFESWYYIMSTFSFSTLARHPRLKTLTIPAIENEWINDLQSSLALHGSMFASLTTLGSTISAHGLSGMLPYLSGIQDLHIQESHFSDSLWSVLVRAEFKFLSSLKLYLHKDTIIESNDFLAFLRYATALQTLIISGIWEEGRPMPELKMEPMDDRTMEAIAKNLPALEYISLGCKSSTGVMGEQSLVSLGVHCSHLEACSIMATIDWMKLVKIAPAGTWPTIKSLPTINDIIDMHEYSEDQYLELAGGILLRMPALDLTGLLCQNPTALGNACINILYESTSQLEEA